MDREAKGEDGVYTIGTRGSDLAMHQARLVADKLKINTRIKIIKTSGDRFQNIPLQGQSQTGFFTKEIERCLHEGEIDIAVHSLKDLPTDLHPDLELAAYLPRADAADLLLIHPDWFDNNSIIPVKQGCRIGATSLRRQSLLRLYGPQAEPAMLRGNVPSRIRKCRSGEYGGIVMAQAGVERLALDLTPLRVFRLNPGIWLPAPGQGVIVVQVRRSHASLQRQVQSLDHALTRSAVDIERRLLAIFEGGCHTAFGAYARSGDGDRWRVRIGMDQPDGGWWQAILKGCSREDLYQIAPGEIPRSRPLEVNRQEELCQPLQR